MATPVVDADAHVYENASAWRELNERRPGWLGFVESGGTTVLSVDGKAYPVQAGHGRGAPIETATNPAAIEGAGDVAVRLRDMDSEGIDIQVLYGSFTIGLTSYDDAGLAAEVAEAYNDWMLDDLCAHNATRLKTVAIVPLQDVELSIAELQRAVRKGAVAVTIPPVVGERNLDDPVFLPFFEAAADADVALGVHSAPGMNLPLPAADRFSNYAQVHALSFPVDQMVAFAALAMGGVLDRFPTLRVAFLESGIGWVPYFVYRVYEHFEKKPDLLAAMKTDPRAHRAGPVLLLLRVRGAAARDVRGAPRCRQHRLRVGLSALGQRLSRHRRGGPPSRQDARRRHDRQAARRQRRPPVRPQWVNPERLCNQGPYRGPDCTNVFLGTRCRVTRTGRRARAGSRVSGSSRRGCARRRGPTARDRGAGWGNGRAAG